MSVTHSLICRTCREQIWIGQSEHLYHGEPKCIAALQEFLFRHKSDPDGLEHVLWFITDDWNDFQHEYKKAEW